LTIHAARTLDSVGRPIDGDRDGPPGGDVVATFGNAGIRLAWAYATAPEHLRDASRALALAERAAGLSPHDPMIRNTLGAGLYRVGRYREAAETFRANFPDQKEELLASDRYFLVMSHHQRAEMAPARA
jgi:hypothetical protein